MPQNQILPDDCSDRNAVKRAVIDALTDDLSILEKLKGILREAGFKAKLVRKPGFEDGWQLRVERGPVTFEISDLQILQRVHHLLEAERISSSFAGYEIVLQGRNFVITFCYKLAAAGSIS